MKTKYYLIYVFVGIAFLAVSAWVTAYICRGHFELWDFLGAFAGITLLTILVYAGGFVAFALAGGEKDWLERLLYILGGIGANVFLIWKIFF